MVLLILLSKKEVYQNKNKRGLEGKTIFLIKQEKIEVKNFFLVFFVRSSHNLPF